MKTVKITFVLSALLLCITAGAQTNYTVNPPQGQQVRNLYGLQCCTYKINVETDEAGNAYVLSENETDSSIWVTKYDYNGNLIYNTHVESGFTSSNKYLAKKIRVYDRVYVLCKMIDPAYGASENVFTLDKNTGAVDLSYATFVPDPGYTGSELLDLVAEGNTVNMIGQVYNTGGPGSNRIQVIRTDLTWTGNIFVLGNDGGTDYLLNTESTCFDYFHGALYMTGQTSSGTGNNIFISRLDVWGFYSEYIYTNVAYPIGGKGLRIAAEGNSVYVAGAMRAQLNKPYRTTVIKMDSLLTAPVWVTVTNSSAWPLGLELSSVDVIYTVDFNLKVVGFSKATGSQLFAKKDFSKNAQVYNQPITTAILNNDQFVFQASTGVSLGHGPNAVNTISKVLVKYSTTGMKVFQQMETVSLISPGNPGYAEALGMAYSSGTDYLTEVYRKYNNDGELIYVQGRAAAIALRLAPVEEKIVAEISVFPNPAKNDFTVQSSKSIIKQIEIVNVLGEKVYDSEDVNRTSYNVNCALPKGMYYLRILMEDGQRTLEKILIQN